MRDCRGMRLEWNSQVLLAMSVNAGPVLRSRRQRHPSSSLTHCGDSTRWGHSGAHGTKDRH